VPAGYRGELLPAWAGTQAFREEEAIPPFYLGGPYMGILVAVFLVIYGMGLALHIYNNHRLWKFLKEQKHRERRI
jgi:hypothetical protein